jgi:intracellular septation protein A
MTQHFEIPRLRVLARHALPHLIESTIVPLVLFLVLLRVVGVWGAVLCGMVWTYGAVIRRLLMGRRVPGILMLSAVTVTARTAVSFATHSVVVYFLQPTLGQILIASAFLISVPLGQPLAQRLARDFVPLPAWLLAEDHIGKFFKRVSLLWAFIGLVNASIALWLLFSQSVGTFYVAQKGASWVLTGTAIGLSTWWFHRLMAEHGHRAPATVPVSTRG